MIRLTNVEASSALDELNRRTTVIADRVRAVAFGHSNGFFLTGRPGSGKTHIVRRTLDELKVKHIYHAGYLTPMGLFELLAEHHDRVIVLDDLAQTLGDRIAIQILLAALGSQPDDRGTRTVRYKRQGKEQTIFYSGGVIIITNAEEVNKRTLMAALKSRVHYLKFDPTDPQIEQLMFHLAKKGWTNGREQMTPAECQQVAEFLVAESHRLNVRLDLRNLLCKGYGDYVLFRSGIARTDWRDLTTATLEEQVVELQYTTSQVGGRKEQIDHERTIARTLQRQHADRATQLAQWKALTGKSDRAYYRRAAEIEKN